MSRAAFLAPAMPFRAEQQHHHAEEDGEAAPDGADALAGHLNLGLAHPLHHRPHPETAPRPC